jgi:hypothetical protein
MRWMEIITLRTMGSLPGSMVPDLMTQMGQAVPGDRPADVRLYHHAELETDLSLIIHWDSKSAGQLKSPLGILLAQAFREFGLVSHSAWMEQVFPA